MSKAKTNLDADWQSPQSTAIETPNKAHGHATARGFDPAMYLALRLAPDMFDSATQVRVLTNLATGTVARLSEQDISVFANDEVMLAGFRLKA